MIYKTYEDQVKAVSFPDRKAIKEDVFQGFDAFVGTKAEIQARESELAEKAAEKYSEALRKHNSRMKAIREGFKAALSEHYGTGHREIDDRVYDKAWQEGHSSGLHEVEVHYEDLAELAQFVYDKAIASA